jgi:hypothetical protein
MGRASIAIAALSCLIAWRSEARAECRATAVPSGEPVLVERLSERLAASGIATTSVEGCPTTRVRIEQRGEQVRVEITDSFGRTGTREVHDVATAATIVESWTAQEVNEGTLPALVETAKPTASIVATTSIAATSWRHGVTAALESSAGSDGSIWLGGAVSGCVRVGPLCVGALARATRDTKAVTDASVLDHDAQELSVLATLGLPRTLGAFKLTPGVGLGYGWLELTEHHHDAHGLPIDMGFTSHAMRADLHVSLAHPLGKHFSAYADVRGDAALLRTDVPYGPRSFLRASFGIRLGAE